MAGRDRDERLFADREDMTRRQGWHARERRRQRLLKGVGLCLAFAFGGLWWQYGPALPDFSLRLPAFLSSRTEPAPTAPRPLAQEQLLVEQAHSPAPQPASSPRPALRKPASLEDCLADNNLIDERVIACRYGELPRSEGARPASGMVSERYLAQYRAERVAARQQPRPRSTHLDNTAEWIPAWDGGGQYLARWQSVNNRIDGNSVCANHRPGSIDHRECRKAAKVWFRDQCRRWEQRTGDQADQLQARYCSAASAFSPM